VPSATQDAPRPDRVERLAPSSVQPSEAAPVRKRRRKEQPLDVFAHDDALLTFASASAISGLGRSTFYRLEAAGEIEFVRMGPRSTRIRAGTLRAFLAARGGAS
jgi:excisionase family DNA binding protein